MENGRAEELHPGSLPLGTVVGRWRVVGWGGRGTYGAVYRAVEVGHEKRGSVALKVAVHEGDPRFEREAVLLSRVEHPNVPVLYEQGQWRLREREYPYLAMQWVQGVSLYDWAAARNPTSRQLLEVLAQLARAVGAIHEAGGVHRDVKGDNALIRLEDGQVFLVDAGLASYRGATPVTSGPLPPGTEAYRSPEAWGFAYEHGRQKGAHYEARPADDVFALGVTAYRLVTDEYPPTTEPTHDKGGLWGPSGAGPTPPLELNPRLNPWLSMLILRMLSVRPEQRGHAAQLAELLEQEAELADAEAALPVFEWEALRREQWPREDVVAASVLGHRPRRRVRSVVYEAEEKDFAAGEEAERLEAEAIARGLARRRRVWPSWAEPCEVLPRAAVFCAGCGLIGLFVSWAVRYEPEELPAVWEVEAQGGEGQADGGTAGLADEVPAMHEQWGSFEQADAGVAKDVPAKPFPGQRRPNDGGRCSQRKETAINGGCWIGLLKAKPPCEDGEYEWEGACYSPSFDEPKGSTSNPP